MDIQERADQIALKTIKDNLKTGLRQPPGDPATRTADCIEQLEDLLGSELNASELARYAAIETYRANSYKEKVDSFMDGISNLLDSVNVIESKNVRAKSLRGILTKLERQHPLVWIGVDIGQIIGRTLKASAAGNKSKEKINQVKAYAIQLFEAGEWKSIRKAREDIWPKVQAEAKRVGWSVTPTQGPETVYNWLLAHNRSTRSADVQG